MALAPTSGSAQIALPAVDEKTSTQTNEIGGRTNFEQLTVAVGRPSVTLRYGHLKAGSESVQMDGRTLVRDTDYYMDYVAGVVYLKVPVRQGQTVTVQYRYDEATGSTGTFGLGTSGNKFQGFTYQMTKGTSMILGMGLTERLGDGTVLSSNVYGLNNAFNFAGGGSLKGLFMVGERQKVRSSNLFGEQVKDNPNIEEGKSQAIIQQVGANLMGGKVTGTYQDIGDKFSGFSAFDGSSFTPDQVQQFANERGLKRSELQFNGLGGKSLGLSSGFKTVGDDQGSITWRNYGANLFGFNVKLDTQKVDPGFTRFKDIAEGDKAQLMKERGLDRQSFQLGKDWKAGSLKYDSTKVETLDGFGFYRRNFDFKNPWLTAAFSDQQVQNGFNRFNDLREADRGQLARESGLVRQNMAFGIAPKNGPALSWSDNVVRTDAGDLDARAFSLKYGKFDVSHSILDVAPGFAALGSLAGPEIQGHVGTIVHMLDPTMNPQGPDMGGWMNAAGLLRSSWNLGYDMGKGSSLTARTEDIQGQQDDLTVRQFGLTTPKVTVGLRQQSAGSNFTDAGKLLFSEQKTLGTAPGLDKTDFNLNAALGGHKALSYSRMSAEDMTGGASRDRFGFTDKNFNLTYTHRNVDSTFASLPGMVDPERDFLLGMVGFDQSEVTGSWQILPTLAVNFKDDKAFAGLNGLGRFGSLFSFKWNPDKRTQLTGSNTMAKQTDPTQPLVDQHIETMQLDRDFGSAGKLSVSHQSATFDGTQDQNPDSTTQSVIYENQLTKTTSIRTEHSLTRYENGQHETTTSNSLSQALTPKVGLSVTDTRIVRDGANPDETHRDYGFWVDFGKNLRFNYKAVRNMKGDTQGTSQSEVSLSPGQIGDFNLGGASYQHNGWDDQRDQSLGKVSLSTVKPFRFGFLQEVQLNYSADTVHDMDVWQRELNTMGVSAKVGAFAFAVGYRSQSLPAGDRAIDRVFSFTTDTSGKSWLRADVKYNLRTLPFGDQVMVRNYTITAEPLKHWQLTHTLLTNPLQDNNNAMLGAIATPTRSNKWGVNYDGNPRTKFGFGYEEFYNEANNQQVTSLKLGATLFANNPSPLVLEYIMAESNATGTMQRSHGFNLGFVQRPGANQSLSFKLSNLNWELSHPADQNLQNWNLRFDYSWKF